jgi:hypothetical protein
MKFIHAGVCVLSSLGLVTLTSTSAWAAPDQSAAEPAAATPAPAPAPAADPGAASAAPVPVAVAAPKAGPTRAPNSINAEGLGAGLVYSFNYERLVLEDLGVRGGISYMSFSASVGTSSASSTFMTFPIEVSYLGVGSAHHMLELGGGMSLLYASGSASGVGYSSSGSGMGFLPNLMIGYRLHPVDGAGFQLRVGSMVFIGKGLGLDVTDPNKIGFLPWPYLSLGASF